MPGSTWLTSQMDLANMSCWSPISFYLLPTDRMHQLLQISCQVCFWFPWEVDNRHSEQSPGKLRTKKGRRTTPKVNFHCTCLYHTCLITHSSNIVTTYSIQQTRTRFPTGKRLTTYDAQNWAAKFSVTTIMSATGIYSKLGHICVSIHTSIHTYNNKKAARNLTSQSPSPKLQD